MAAGRPRGLGMAGQRVVDPVGRGIGLVDADGEGRVGLKPADQEIGQAAIVVEQDADLPGAGLAEIDRSEGVDGDQRRWPSIGHAAREAGVDCVMIGCVDVGEPSRALCSLEPRLAGTGRPSLSVTMRLVASGARLQSMMRREASGQKSGASSFADRMPRYGQRAGIPGDVRLQRILGKSKRLIGFRNAV